MQKNDVNSTSLFSTIVSSVWGGILAIILYCSWSYLNVWEFNYIHNEYIDYTRLLVVFISTLIFAGLVFFFLYFFTFFRSFNKALFATGAFMFIFFNFHLLSKYISNIYLYFIFLCGVTGATYYFSKNLLFKKIIVIIPIVAIIGIFGNVVAQKYVFTKTVLQQDWNKSIFANLNSKPKHTPNVYFIIVDSTLRSDAFKRFYNKEDKHYDDFLSYSKDKGFYVVKNAYSNYPVTGFSIPSTLNMEYMTWSSSEGPPEIKNKPLNYPTTLTDAMKGYSATSVAFKKRGYKIYHTSNGFLPASDCGGFEDKCIRKKKQSLLSFTQQELGLIKMTPITLLDKKGIAKPNDNFISDIKDDTIVFFHSFQPRDIPQYIPDTNGAPFFWFIHLMGMHNLAFAEDCSFKHPGEKRKIDIEELKPACQVGELYSARMTVAYKRQLPCILSQLKFAIDEIIKKDPQAIIIIQGDHGSSVVNNFKERPTEKWTEKDIHEVFSILNIIRCPEDCQKLLYDNITPVNTFRVIFSYIDGKKYPLLPDISYIAAYVNWWPSYKNGDADLVNPALKVHPNVNCPADDLMAMMPKESPLPFQQRSAPVRIMKKIWGKMKEISTNFIQFLLLVR